MTTPLSDLPALLHDAVDEIEPADRIDAIRARTASSPARAARRWWYAAGGVALATAAAVAAFALVDRAPDGGPAPDATGPSRPGGTQVVAAYFLGRTPDGYRLFREFDRVPAGDALQAALDRIQRPATDPDYETLWPHGSLVGARVHRGTIELELADNAPSAFAGVVEGLPEQQVVYTLQAAVGRRLPVQPVRDGRPWGEPLTADPGALSNVLVSDPVEGRAVHDGFTARGAAPAGDRVRWELRTEAGRVVARGVGTGDREWRAPVDVGGLPDGFYTFVASVGRSSDTRTIIVR